MKKEIKNRNIKVGVYLVMLLMVIALLSIKIFKDCKEKKAPEKIEQNKQVILENMGKK